MGRKTSLDEQKAVEGTRRKKKKRLYDLWKKNQATQKDCKDFVREKLRRAKAQLEVKLATAVNDQKKKFL